MTTALIVEDEPHIHAQLGALLAELWPALKIVATAEDDVTALAAFREHEPDVLFLDVKMPATQWRRSAASSRSLHSTVRLCDRVHHRVRRLRCDHL